MIVIKIMNVPMRWKKCIGVGIANLKTTMLLLFTDHNVASIYRSQCCFYLQITMLLLFTDHNVTSIYRSQCYFYLQITMLLLFTGVHFLDTHDFSFIISAQFASV